MPPCALGGKTGRNHGRVRTTPLIDLTASFLGFLKEADVAEENRWASYRRLYIQPNNPFMEAYLGECLELQGKDLRAAVAGLTPADYGYLKEGGYLPGIRKAAAVSLERCGRFSPGHPEPSLFLFLGFFSPPAFLLFVEGRPVIALALERRPEISGIPPLVAHEYGHYLVSLILELEGPWAAGQAAERMASEGLAVHYSREAYPELPDHQHYFLSRSRLRECRRAAGDLIAVGTGGDRDEERLAEFFLRYPAFPRGCRAYLAHRLLEEGAGEGLQGDFDGLVRRVFRGFSMETGFLS